MDPPNYEPRILVVEDEDLTRNFAVEMIASLGYSVIGVENSMAAMRRISEMPSIELVFTDVRMPGVDGIILADMLKQHRPRLKILYTTGGGIGQIKAGAGILHGNILLKPYRPEQLLEELRRALG